MGYKLGPRGSGPNSIKAGRRMTKGLDFTGVVSCDRSALKRYIRILEEEVARPGIFQKRKTK